MAIISILFIIQFFIAENTYLPLDTFSFLVIIIGLGIFTCLCFVKISYDAITHPTPKHDPWDVIKCRVCNEFIVDCMCHPIPCPFCNDEYGFLQDWNVHLIKFHDKEIKKAVNAP